MEVAAFTDLINLSGLMEWTFPPLPERVKSFHASHTAGYSDQAEKLKIPFAFVTIF